MVVGSIGKAVAKVIPGAGKSAAKTADDIPQKVDEDELGRAIARNRGDATDAAEATSDEAGTTVVNLGGGPSRAVRPVVKTGTDSGDESVGTLTKLGGATTVLGAAYFGKGAADNYLKTQRMKSEDNKDEDVADSYRQARADILNSNIPPEQKQEQLEELENNFEDIADQSDGSGGGGLLGGILGDMGIIEQVALLIGLLIAFVVITGGGS